MPFSHSAAPACLADVRGVLPVCALAKERFPALPASIPAVKESSPTPLKSSWGISCLATNIAWICLYFIASAISSSLCYWSEGRWKTLRISPWRCSQLSWRLYSLEGKMRELNNVLTPDFTWIKSENQVCNLIAHNVVYETLGLRRWRSTAKNSKE